MKTIYDMSSNENKIVAASAFAGFTAAALSLWVIKHLQKHRDTLDVSGSRTTTAQQSEESLHWDPLQERRGIGDLIIKANHIAIIVSDVGRSLSFYVDVLGLQQIRRPNFDRHGAWLTMGNLELHLIKGIPIPPSNDNLIVGHISLETKDMKETLRKLCDLKIEFRQNISVPDPKTSRENRFEGSASRGPTGVIQYFFTDPDGYYIELCNCDILTEFCLNKEKSTENITYHEGIKRCRAFTVVQVAMRWRRLARRKRLENFDDVLQGMPRASELNLERYENLCRRRFTYGDIMQGFSDDEVKEALLLTFNHVPIAIKTLTQQRGKNRHYEPPSFYEKGQLTKPKAFQMAYIDSS